MAYEDYVKHYALLQDFVSVCVQHGVELFDVSTNEKLPDTIPPIDAPVPEGKAPPLHAYNGALGLALLGRAAHLNGNVELRNALTSVLRKHGIAAENEDLFECWAMLDHHFNLCIAKDVGPRGATTEQCAAIRGDECFVPKDKEVEKSELQKLIETGASPRIDLGPALGLDYPLHVKASDLQGVLKGQSPKLDVNYRGFGGSVQVSHNQVSVGFEFKF